MADLAPRPTRPAGAPMVIAAPIVLLAPLTAPDPGEYARGAFWYPYGHPQRAGPLSLVLRRHLPVRLSFSGARSMRRAIGLLMLILSDTGLPAAESTTVTQRIEDRNRPFAGSLKTKFEGLAVALLGSCHAETTLQVGNKEHWDEALKGDHILATFAKPRVFSMNDQQDSSRESELEASEILVPIGPSGSPDQIYVRNGDRYRAFCKYEFEILDAFQKELRSMPPPAPK